MRSEQLEGIVTMLRDAAAAGEDSAERTLEDWRASYAGLAALLPSAPGVSVEAVVGADFAGEWIVPDAGWERTVVYVHGGGYCIGGLDSHRPMLTHLAVAAAARVLSVDYRLAPEHPFPAALDDAVAAYRHALANGSEPGRTAFAGDSAGGGLTVATLVALREAGIPMPAIGVCLSPWADLTQSGESMTGRAGADPMVRAEDLDRWADMYRGDRPAKDPGISPLFAELYELPLLHVEVGTDEVLLDDAVRLVERARAEDVEAELVVAKDMIHVWHFFAGAVPEADEGIERVAAAIVAATS